MWDGNKKEEIARQTIQVEREPMWDGNLYLAPGKPLTRDSLSENQCGMETYTFFFISSAVW